MNTDPAWCIVPAMPHHRTTFHGTAIWKRTRRVARIEAAHRCQRCGRFLPGKGELHVHHRKPVERAPALALEPLNFMVVCPPCHNIIEPRSGAPPRLGCDIDGNPLSEHHPWNLKDAAAGEKIQRERIRRLRKFPHVFQSIFGFATAKVTGSRRSQAGPSSKVERTAAVAIVADVHRC